MPFSLGTILKHSYQLFSSLIVTRQLYGLVNLSPTIVPSLFCRPVTGSKDKPPRIDVRIT
jgi:hypothetical protein